MTKTSSTSTRQVSAKIRIRYHKRLAGQFAQWAAACNLSPAKLRRLSEVAINTRHRQAGRAAGFPYTTIEEFESAPFTLPLGDGVENVYVYYSLKGCSYLIRGYGWDFFEDDYGDQISDDQLGVGGYYR